MPLFRFEHHTQMVASHRVFLGRLAMNTLAAIAIIAAALAIGMIGYRATERMGWLEAFLNASMLLGGMARWMRCTPPPASFSPAPTLSSAAC